MANFIEGRYSTSELQRNRTLIGGLGVGAMALFAVLAATTDWPWSNAIASSVVALVFVAALWWMFATRKAGPVTLSKTSKSWFSSIAQPWNKRQSK